MKINNLLSEKIKELYLQGYSTIRIRDIISKENNVNVCSESVRKKLVKLGVKFRNRKEAITLRKRQHIITDDLIKEYRKTNSTRAVARKMKVSRSTIRKIFQENSISIMENSEANKNRKY